MLMKKIKTLVVDDSHPFRESIKVFLQEQPEIELVGLVESGEKCLEFVNQNSVDLVIMDARMSGMDGPETTETLKKKHPDIKVIICTIWAEKEARDYAPQSGALYYFIKGEPLSSLLKKIKYLFS